MTSFVPGNRLSLLEGGRQYFPALIDACDSARTEIHVETYIFDADASGISIAAALIRAAGRGVAVHLLIDGYGSKSLDTGLIRDMRQAGVRLLVYRPDITPWRFPRQRLRRLHRKLAVIDGAIAFIGGINIIDDMHTPRHKPPRVDFCVRIEGPLLADIHPIVKRLWRLAQFTNTGQGWSQPPLSIRAESAGDQLAALVIRDNLRHRRDIEHAYLQAIDSARHEILIACAYFFPGQEFRRALVAAARRGVKVVLLLQARVEYMLLHYAARALYGVFLDAGIEIIEYHRSFLHAKVAVIDKRWATVGSSNIDPLSLLLAREANVFVLDEPFARILSTRLQRMIESGAHPVRPATWHQQPLLKRWMIWIFYGAARLLIGFVVQGSEQLRTPRSTRGRRQ